MLDVNAIDLHYGAAQALRTVSLRAEPGKVTCVLGRNGVGKTSLLDALAGQHSVTRGTITWEGQDITALRPPERARRGISYVPQGREIFPLLTVEENLRTGFAPLKRDERSIPADVYALFPILRERRSQAAPTLSGGQQQMAAIGRALMSNPRILLCDEISLGLAPIIIADVYAALPQIKAEGTSVVLVEQDIVQAMKVADRVYCFQEGRLSLTGRPRELTREAIHRAYFGS